MLNREQYGPWAVIAGASEGIGVACAHKLAAQGFGLVLAARSADKLDALKADLAETGADIRTVAADLSTMDGVQAVIDAASDVEVGALIHLAGANSVRGNFVELDEEVYRTVIGVNVISQVELARHFGAAMQKRGRGGIILAGSLSGFMGSPSLASYTASKAFSRIFSEALWAECKPMGVDVLHLVVGFTATPAMAKLGIDISKAQDPAEVAEIALSNIANGPICFATGDEGEATAQARSGLANRGDAISQFATPSRESMNK